MDAVYPAGASALARGRRLRRRELDHSRQRHRTMPVTFAEIKEVDEESSADVDVGEGGEERRRRPDVLDERLGSVGQLAVFRRRRGRARAEALRELSPPAPLPTRAVSEPEALHRHPDDAARAAPGPPAPAPHT